MNKNNPDYKKELKIVFMGTPEFAVPSLMALVEQGYHVVGVITSVDKHGGRGGRKLMESDVKKYAQSQQLLILQPKNLKDPDFIDTLRSLEADLQIVVAFRMLPVVVWDMPPLGTYNLHGSLLPKYRGAAPIHWAVINGEKQTGVTSFKLKHEIDTGDILIQEKMAISEEETSGDVHDRMKYLASKVIIKTVKAIEKGDIQLKCQQASKVSKAPKIFHKQCRIDFHQNSKKVYNFIRGMSPYPAAWTILDGKEFKIFKAGFIVESHDYPAGTLLTNNKSYIHYTTKDGFIILNEIQLQGKKKMGVKSFLNGYNINQ